MRRYLHNLISRNIDVNSPMPDLQREIIETNKFLDYSLGENYLIKDALTIKRSCPLCKMDSETIVFTFMGFRWMFCDKCQLNYVQNILASDFHLSNTYSYAIKHMDGLNNFSQESAVVEQAMETLHYIREVFPEFGQICDIGCGNGTFLKKMNMEGYDVFGIDINPEAIKSTKSKGIDAALVQDVLAQGLGTKKTPVLFTMRQVIEHVQDVKGLLEWLDSLVSAPWGLLVETPNLNSWTAKRVNFKHHHFYGWSHQQIFSPETIRVIARDFKMNLLDVKSYGKGFGMKSFIETRYAPWIFHPFGQESISRWPDLSFVSKSDHTKDTRIFRKIAINSLRKMDNVLGYMRPETGEYIRASFLKEKN